MREEIDMNRSIGDRLATPGLLRLILPVLAAASCAGCGLAGTAVATGAGAAAEVQQAQQAKQDEDKVKRELDQAQHDAAQQREAAESQGK
jgi:hypothetical protein